MFIKIDYKYKPHDSLSYKAYKDGCSHCQITDMAQRLSKDHYLNSEKMLCKRLKSDKVGRHYHSRRVVCPIMIRRNLTYKNTISRITAG